MRRKEQVLEHASNQVGNVKTLANKFIKYVYTDANCILMAHSTNGQFFSFNSVNEFDLLPLHIDNTTKATESVYDLIALDLESTYAGE